MANIPPNHRITADKAARSPKCARCRNHGFIIPVKGHSGKCQFKSCVCSKCSLVAERTKILSVQKRIKTGNENELPSGDRPGHSTQSGGKRVAVANSTSGLNDERKSATIAPGGRDDAGNKTCNELHVPVIGPGKTTSATAVHCELKTSTGESASYCAPGDPPALPGEHVITEAIPRHVFPGEMFAMPLHLYPHYPDRYMYPAVLLTLRPPTPGPFTEPFGFFPSPPSAQSYPLETHESQFHIPYYSLYPTYPVLREEHEPRPHHQLQPHMDGQQGTSTLLSQAGRMSESHVCGNQELDVVAVDDLSSKNTQ